MYKIWYNFFAMERKKLEEFLDREEKNIQDVNLEKIFALIKNAVVKHDKSLLEYENLMSIGAENKGKRFYRKDLEGFLNQIYEIWWDHWLIPKSKMDNNYQKTVIQKYIDAEVFDPHSDKRIPNIFTIMDELKYRYLFEDTCYFQGNYFCVIDTNRFSVDREKHARFCYDSKLYLNIKLENRIELAKRMIEKALKKNIPFVFKFALYDQRTDNVVIYVDFENVSLTADMIDEVKKENPHLFEGCQVKNPLLATYRKYMGFGEEAIYSSYNSARTDILMMTYKELSKLYNKDPNSLTDENIKKIFKKNCWNLCIDYDRFYTNKWRAIGEEYKEEE